MADHDTHSASEAPASHAPHGGPGPHGGGHEEAHEGAPEWLISFADNVTLMMGFFVIMLAMNMGPKSDPVQGGAKSDNNAADGFMDDRTMEYVVELRRAFNNPIDMNSSRPSEAALRDYILRSRGGDGTSEGVTGRHKSTQTIRPGELTTLGAAIPFDDGSAELSATGRAVAAETAQKVKGQRFVVEVRGHSSASETFRRADQGVTLSFQRALAVARVLAEQGVPWSQLRLVGCGDSERMVPRAGSRPGERPNQRVEVLLTQQPMGPDPYSRETGAVPDAGAPEPSGASASGQDAKPAGHGRP